MRTRPEDFELVIARNRELCAGLSQREVSAATAIALELLKLDHKERRNVIAWLLRAHPPEWMPTANGRDDLAWPYENTVAKVEAVMELLFFVARCRK